MKALLHDLAEYCWPEPEVLEPELVAERRESLRRIAAMSYAERRAGALRLAWKLRDEYPLIVGCEARRFRGRLAGAGLRARTDVLQSLWGSLMVQFSTARTIDWLVRRYELDALMIPHPRSGGAVAGCPDPTGE